MWAGAVPGLHGRPRSAGSSSSIRSHRLDPGIEGGGGVGAGVGQGHRPPSHRPLQLGRRVRRRLDHRDEQGRTWPAPPGPRRAGRPTGRWPRPWPAMGVTGVNPYKGLRSFQEADATEFCGRDALVAELVERVTASRSCHRGGAVGVGQELPGARRGGPRAAPPRRPGRLDGARRRPDRGARGRPAAGRDRRGRGHHRRPAPHPRRPHRDRPGPHRARRTARRGRRPVRRALDPRRRRRGAGPVRRVAGPRRGSEDGLRVVVTLRADQFDLPLQHPRSGRWSAPAPSRSPP